MKTPLKYFSRIALIVLMCLPGVAEGKSLWRKAGTNERGMFAQKVASKVGDIITVVVSEETTQSNSLQTTTAKNASIVGSVTSYLFPSSGFGKHGGEFPSTNINLNNDDYSGGGSISNSSSLEISIPAQVVDVLPNGNLVIHGQQVITFGEEREFATITGIVRPYDIVSDNTIASNRIGDKRLSIVKEGALSAAQKKGWFLRFKDFINPF